MKVSIGEQLRKETASLPLCLEMCTNVLWAYDQDYLLLGNIYWVDRGHHAIQVARLDGSHRYVIIHDNLDKPRNIAVDPKNGWVLI